MESRGHADDPIYPTFKIEVLDKLLSAEGIDSDRLLEGTKLDAAAMRSSDTRISRQELVKIYQNASQLTDQPGRLALSAGRELRLASYGMYGFAMMTSPNFRHALEFSVRYHQLASPTVRMTLRIDDDEDIAIMQFDDQLGIPELQVFNLELQFSLFQSLTRDMVGDQLSFESFTTSYAAPAHAAVYEEYFACPIYFGKSSNEIRFKDWWLRQPLKNASPVTADLTHKVCEKMLATMPSQTGTAEAVNALLNQNPRDFHNIEKVAEKLRISSRTLRRRLTDENISFHDLQRDARKRFAIAYLRETRMSIDDIADQLGFSDAANFRRAFKQWTGEVPSHFRS